MDKIIKIGKRVFPKKEVEIAINVGNFATTASDDFQNIMENWCIDEELSEVVDVILEKGVSLEEAINLVAHGLSSNTTEYKDYCELIAIGEFCGKYEEAKFSVYQKMIKDYCNQDKFHYMEEFLIHNKFEYG